MIEAQDITLCVGKRNLLKNVSLEIPPAQFTAVAGPNGAGKTSLLKVLSNEWSHYRGKVLINGASVSASNASMLSRVRAVLSQQTQVQFPFTVRQIIEMARHHQQKRSDAVEEVMELTGVSEWTERNYQRLSGGEQQRVQLARVLAQVWDAASFPRYILLDEPTSSLDIAQQQLTFQLVKKACERNIGVFAIVHDLNQVVQFADRLYFMKGGEIVAAGEPKKIFTKPIIEETFCCKVNVYLDPCTNCPYVVPDKLNHSTLNTITV